MLYRTLLKIWLLPPTLNILLIILGILMLKRFRRLGLTSIWLGVVSLLVMSLPIVANGLLKSIEIADALQSAQLLGQNGSNRPAAIVVLGAGHDDFWPEYGVPFPGSGGQLRAQYGAWLKQRTTLPLMLTGGQPGHSKYKHAQVLADYMQHHLNTSTDWIEAQSRTTWENALYARQILQPLSIDHIYLVTQSVHMRRSILLFERAGFTVTPAPTQLSSDMAVAEIVSWLPSTTALNKTAMVLHEVMGYWWYRATLGAS